MLNAAVDEDQLEIVKFLLDQPGIDVNRFYGGPSEAGCSPLVLACRRKSVEIVRVLLQAPGIDVNICAVDEDEEFTPLHLAVSRGSTEVIKLLLHAEGINMNALSSLGFSPLQWACMEGSVDVVKILARAKGIDLNGSGSSCPTPLHYASQSERCEMLKILLETPCAWGQGRLQLSNENFCSSGLGDCFDTDRGTPLWWAITNNRIKNAELLLADERMDIRQELDAFALAVESATVEIVAAFLKRAREGVLLGRSQMEAVACKLNKDVARKYFVPLLGLEKYQNIVTQEMIDAVHKYTPDKRTGVIELLKDFVTEFGDISQLNFHSAKKRKRPHSDADSEHSEGEQ